MDRHDVTLDFAGPDGAGIRRAHEQGPVTSARLAAGSLALCRQFDNDDRREFLHDRRALNQRWEPQQSEADAVAVAEAQSNELNRLSPRRPYEFRFVRKPLFAAWVATLCPDRDLVEQNRAAVIETTSHYRYDRPCYSQFLPAKNALVSVDGQERVVGAVLRRLRRLTS